MTSFTVNMVIKLLYYELYIYGAKLWQLLYHKHNFSIVLDQILSRQPMTSQIIEEVRYLSGYSRLSLEGGYKSGRAAPSPQEKGSGLSSRTNL